MTPAADDESGTGMAVDEPRAGETALGAITVAGWAPDPQVWTGLEAGFREEARDRESP